VHNYGRDGRMRFDDNGGRGKNYEPNSFDGPRQSGQPYEGRVAGPGLGPDWSAASHSTARSMIVR
jgi:catalase